MGDETDDDEYADYDDEEEEYAQMQQTMLLNMSTLVQLWESVRNQEEGNPVKQSRIPRPFAPEMFVYMYLSQLMSTFTNYLKVHRSLDGCFIP